MFGLACILLIVLFVAAIIFRKKFVNAALSFISGTPAKHHGMLESIPAWAKVLLTERIMDRFGQKGTETKQEDHKVEVEKIEPEFPPQHNDVIIDIEFYSTDHEKLIGTGGTDHEKLIGTGGDDRAGKTPGPILLPPWNGEADHKRDSEITQEPQIIQEVDDELVFDTTEKKEESDQAMQKYYQYLNEVSQPEQHEQEKMNMEGDPLIARYQEIKEQLTGNFGSKVIENPPGNNTEIQNINDKAGESMQNKNEKPSSFDIAEKPPFKPDEPFKHGHSNIPAKSEFDQLLEQHHDPEKEKERELATQKYYQFLNEASRQEHEQEDLINNENALTARYREIEEDLKG